MINPIRAIALGCAALLGAAVVTTAAVPSAQAQGYYRHDDRGWRGHDHDRGYYRHGHGYYRGGGPVYVQPAQPVYVHPRRPGITFRIGR